MKLKIDQLMGRVFMSLIFFVLLFALGEGITRHLKIKKNKDKSPFAKFNDPKTRVLKPYVMFGGQPNAMINKESGETLNDLGYRGDLPSLEKPDGEFRIILFGGSTVMLPNLHAYLQDDFHQNGFDHVKVYNFGSISSETGQSLARLIYEVMDLKPDVVVQYEGGNDIMDRYFADPRPGYPYNFMVHEKNPLLEMNIKDYPLFPLMANASSIFRSEARKLIRAQILDLETLREEAGYLSEPWKEQIINSYIDNIQKSAKVAEAVGAQYISFYQPLSCTKAQLTEQEKNLLEPEAFDYCLTMQSRVRAQLKQLNEKKFVDLSTMFDQHQEHVFHDYIHLMPKYNSIVADRIYQEMIGRLNIKSNI